MRKIKLPYLSSMSIIYPILGYQTTFRQVVNCGDYSFLEKSPCWEEVRGQQGLEGTVILRDRSLHLVQ